MEALCELKVTFYEVLLRGRCAKSKTATQFTNSAAVAAIMAFCRSTGDVNQYSFN